MPDVLEPPATPAPPPATPSPTPDAPRGTGAALEDFDRTFADLDETAPAPEPTPEPAATPSPKPKDPETGRFTKQEPKPEPAKVPDKPAAAPDKPAAAPEFEPPQVAKPSELRNWAKRMGSRAEQAEQNLVQLKREVNELRSKPGQSADTKALTDELAATKKRLDEHERELKVTRYERSGEYKDKYEKPYQNAVNTAYAEVQELLVSVPNPEDPDNPRERAATAADFDEVYNLPLGPATKLAKAKFGDAAGIVLQHRQAIKGAAKAAVTAIEEHKGKAVEFEQAQTAQQKMFEEGRSRMFNEAKQAIAQKYAALFGERDGDTAWNEALAKGRNMADLAFSDRKDLTPEQSAILDAQVHARISAFPGLRAENDKLKADLAARDKEIADLRGSGPGKPGAGTDKPATTDNLTLDEAFDRAIPA